MKNNNRISVKAVCASITGALMERNEDNFCFNGIGMPEVHDDLEENLTAEVVGRSIRRDRRSATWRRGFLSGCQNAAGRRTAMDGAGRAELRNHSAANAEKNK